jgi:hypothetical protein
MAIIANSFSYCPCRNFGMPRTVRFPLACRTVFVFSVVVPPTVPVVAAVRVPSGEGLGGGYCTPPNGRDVSEANTFVTLREVIHRTGQNLTTRFSNYRVFKTTGVLQGRWRKIQKIRVVAGNPRDRFSAKARPFQRKFALKARPFQRKQFAKSPFPVDKIGLCFFLNGQRENSHERR